MTALATPDVEAIAWALLKDLGGIHVYAYAANAAWPFVTESVDIQVDVRASTKKAARDRAYVARNLLLNLPFDPTQPQVVACDIVSGPLWLPEQDGAPRYVLRVSILTRGLSST